MQKTIDHDCSLMGPGSDAVLVDSQSDMPTEIVKIQAIDADRREFLVSGYTARFSMRDGRGVALVETENRPGCRVLDMKGYLLDCGDQPTPTVVRVVPARYSIRPATVADHDFLRDQGEAVALAATLASRLAKSARKMTPFSLARLREIEALIDASGPASGAATGMNGLQAAS